MKRRLISSYTAQAYIGLIGILLMPIYMQQMGVEAVGLIGVFLMLQAWLQLLDLGLSQTLSRDMSLFHVGTLDSAGIWQRLRVLELLLGLVSVIAAAAIVAAKNWIASDWLTRGNLPAEEIATSVAAMALAAAFRFMMGLYRASLVGLGRQIAVNTAAVAFASLKFVGVLPLLIYWSSAPSVFFAYQATVGGLELVVFFWMLYSNLPARPIGIGVAPEALRSMLPMAAAMAFSALIWSVITQADKLLLSRILSLEDYGYFTLAALAASGVLMLIPPLNQVLQPRMTMLLSDSRVDELRHLYQLATQSVTVVFLSFGGVMAWFAEPLLLAWTGDARASQLAAPVLFWYGLASVSIGLLLLPFMLQFAHGNLKLHVIGNTLMVLLLIPLMVAGAIEYGGVGTGAALLLVNLLFIVFWVPLVHRRFMPQVLWTWPFLDVGKIAVPVVALLVVARELMPDFENRIVIVMFLGAVLCFSLAIGTLLGSRTRRLVLNAKEVQG